MLFRSETLVFETGEAEEVTAEALAEVPAVEEAVHVEAVEAVEALDNSEAVEASETEKEKTE